MRKKQFQMHSAIHIASHLQNDKENAFKFHNKSVASIVNIK